MTKIDEEVKTLYTSDEYLAKFPELFQEDTPWKLSKILPVLDRWAGTLGSEQKEVSILDVGGGAGLILKGVSSYLEDRYSLSVRKQALDISSGMLQEQQKNNPDLVQALQEDIARTSLADKSIDLTLLIDVLEHVPESVAALQELKRISRHVLFKVPLEDHLLTRLTNFFNRGETKKLLATELGHVNLYKAKTLRKEIQEYLGPILHFSYTNAYAYEILRCAQNDTRGGGRLRLVNRLCAELHRMSPALAARIYTDFVLVLVECETLELQTKS
jgi:ubiquinone/menaquinone biosynthesis C-methylase UbiE